MALNDYDEKYFGQADRVIVDSAFTKGGIPKKHCAADDPVIVGTVSSA